MDFKTDCRFFNGYTPCKPHKTSKISCGECTAYEPVTNRILIVKTGAAGDVIRTTPILKKLRLLHPLSEIHWITLYPEFIPKNLVNKIWMFNWENCMTLMGQKFNLVINLDKSLPEANLIKMVVADEVWGFVADGSGKILPANVHAQNKWVTGLDDVKMAENTKHFVEELFEICGWNFENEKYCIQEPQKTDYNLKRSGRKVIGLNTGCGERWVTRLWPTGHFEELSRLLKKQGYTVVLLGGPTEDAKNKMISKNTGAKYLGVKPLPEFVDLVSQCDVVLTSVTMALHIALALEKRVVLLNNIFPKNEFHMYGLGQILEPDISCKACYKNTFDSKCHQYDCMGLVTPQAAFEQIVQEINRDSV